MVTIVPIPSATASASSEQLLVQVTEGLCQAYSTSATIQPQSSLSFVVGTPSTESVTSGTTTTYNAIVPIDIIGQITYQAKNSTRVINKLFAETFTVGFTGLTAAPTTFTVTTGMQTTSPYNVKSCNRAYGYTINTAITITAA